MLAAVTLAGADRRADDERDLDLGAAHEVPLGGLVGDLVRRHQGEVHVHELDHGAQADDRRADGGAADRGLGDRRVEHALAPERLEQALGELEGAAVVGDVLAVEDDAPVAGHLLGEGLAQRVAIRDRTVGAGLRDRRPVRRSSDGSASSGTMSLVPSVYRKSSELSGAGSVACDARTAARALRSRTRCSTAATPAASATPAATSCPLRFSIGSTARQAASSSLGPVLVARVGQGVPVVAVGRCLDQHRPLARRGRSRRRGVPRRARPARPSR